MIDAAIVDLIRSAVGHTRVYPSTNSEPVYKNMPKVLYTLLDIDRDYCDDGNVGLPLAFYQLDIFAADPLTARTVADTIRTDLDGFRGDEYNGTDIVRIYFGGERFLEGSRIEGQNNTPARYAVDMYIRYRE